MHVLVSPLGFGLLLAVLAAAAWRRLGRVARAALAVVELVLLALICPLGANLLVWLVESQVAAGCAGVPPDTIVVLSAGFDRPPASADDIAALSGASLKRVLAGVDLWQRTPDATLVLSGGGPFAISEAAVLQNFAERLGVPAPRIRREEQSQTTWENAERLRVAAPPLPKRIWLVSSALHLPRAQIAFRANGFATCARVTDRRYLPPGGIGYFLPQSSSLYKAEAAIHELVGGAWYRWRARAEADRQRSND